MTARELTAYDKALLWHAIEGTYLIEMREGADDLPAANADEHRRKVAEALLRLVKEGYVRTYLVPWSAESISAGAELAYEELRKRLATDETWSVDEERLVAFGSTETGRRVHLPSE